MADEIFEDMSYDDLFTIVRWFPRSDIDFITTDSEFKCFVYDEKMTRYLVKLETEHEERVALMGGDGDCEAASLIGPGSNFVAHISMSRTSYRGLAGRHLRLMQVRVPRLTAALPDMLFFASGQGNMASLMDSLLALNDGELTSATKLSPQFGASYRAVVALYESVGHPISAVDSLLPATADADIDQSKARKLYALLESANDAADGV